MSGTASGSGSGATDKVKRARNTMSSLLSYYFTNRESLERIPSFVSDTSQEIMIRLQSNTVPSAEQAEELKKQLNELVATQEAINNIPAWERQRMIEAAKTSAGRRKGGN